MDKLKSLFDTLKQVSSIVQDALTVRGDLYVDCFAIVMLLRLLGPFKGFPAMTPAEAGLWAATIASFAYSNGGPKQS